LAKNLIWHCPTALHLSSRKKQLGHGHFGILTGLPPSVVPLSSLLENVEKTL
jgi:hypothetical protein